MSNGRQLMQKRPYGVINVVSLADSAVSSICQNPELASSFEKTFAFPICANTFSTDERM